MTKRFLVLYVFANLVFLSCIYCTQMSESSLRTTLGDQTKGTVQSTVQEGLIPHWSFDSLKFKEGLHLTAVQFIDMNHGWIAGHGGLVYSTSDGGRTWSTSELGTGVTSYVSSISFLRNGVGWVTVRRNPSDAMNRRGYQSIVLKTNNAGQSWQEQGVWHGVQIYRVNFVSSRDGWLVGRRLEDDRPFLLHTKDGGSNWNEFSQTLPNTPSSDFATDIHANEASRTTLLTVEGRVYSSSDGGRNWNEDLVIRDEPEQTFMAKIGILQNNSLWVLGSTDSKEGMWTTIVKQHNDHSLIKFRVDGVRIRDMVFLSENKVLACGSMSSNVTALFGDRIGVVLYSSDGGRTWGKIYSDAEGRRLNAIAADADNVWVVGEQGLVLHSSTSEKSEFGNNQSSAKAIIRHGEP